MAVNTGHRVAAQVDKLAAFAHANEDLDVSSDLHSLSRPVLGSDSLQELQVNEEFCPHLRRGHSNELRFQTFHVWLPSPGRSRG